MYGALESKKVMIHMDILKCLDLNSDPVQTQFRSISDLLFEVLFNKMMFYLINLCIIKSKSELSLN